MYHRTRQSHRWIGIIAAIFLVVISATGFLLALKSHADWMRPPEAKAATKEGPIVTVEAAMQAAFGLNLADMRDPSDIDRVDYRPKSNIFKVISKRGYHEVQVDGSNGKVLTHSFRNDQLVEDIHDFSFFSSWSRDWVLPGVAILLFGLAASGIGLFFTPVVRRWKFRRKKSG